MSDRTAMVAPPIPSDRRGPKHGAPPKRMAKYSRHIGLPKNVGDSLDVRWVTCRFCRNPTTVVLERVGVPPQGNQPAKIAVRATVALCCDFVKAKQFQLEGEMSQ